MKESLRRRAATILRTQHTLSLFAAQHSPTPPPTYSLDMATSHQASTLPPPPNHGDEERAPDEPAHGVFSVFSYPLPGVSPASPRRPDPSPAVHVIGDAYRAFSAYRRTRAGACMRTGVWDAYFAAAPRVLASIALPPSPRPGSSLGVPIKYLCTLKLVDTRAEIAWCQRLKL